MKKFVFGLSVMFVFGFCLNVSAQPAIKSIQDLEATFNDLKTGKDAVDLARTQVVACRTAAQSVAGTITADDDFSKIMTAQLSKVQAADINLTQNLDAYKVICVKHFDAIKQYLSDVFGIK
jgi:hypothetical protein